METHAFHEGMIGSAAFTRWLENYYAGKVGVEKAAIERLGCLPSWQDLVTKLAMSSGKEHSVNFVKSGKSISLACVRQGRSDMRKSEAEIAGGCDHAWEDRVNHLIRDGYSIIWSEAHRNHESLYRLCAGLAGLLNVDVRANVYASWAGESPFGLHWDEHDVMVLHVYGKKRWQIWTSAQPMPPTHAFGSGAAPSGSVSDAIDVEAGDMLFLPRGTWHVTRTLSGPSLHVTIGVKTLIGADIIEWVGNALIKDTKAWQRVPFWRTDEEVGWRKGELSNILNGIKVGDSEHPLVQYARARISCAPVPTAEFDGEGSIYLRAQR